jgi:hypothetical protein
LDSTSINDDALSKLEDETWEDSDPRQPYDDQDGFDADAAGQAAVAKIFRVARRIISKMQNVTFSVRLSAPLALQRRRTQSLCVIDLRFTKLNRR